MKKYIKPSLEVVELRVEENIAKVPTTIYKKGASGWTKAQLLSVATNVFNENNPSF